MILTIRTDNPEAEVGVYDANGNKQAYETWHAHRELEATLLKKIEEVLGAAGGSLHEITGVVLYEGPGSFTGLRIGFAVGNTLASSLDVPNATAGDQNWQLDGIKQIAEKKAPEILIPNYGGEANITKPKK